MRLLSPLPILALLGWNTASATPIPPIDRCLDSLPSVERVRCIQQEWSDVEMGKPHARRLESVLIEDAETVAAVADWIEGRWADGALDRTGPEAGVAARILELHGRALASMGRPAEAADKLTAAFDLDPGLPELHWFDAGGERRWRKPVAAGPRLEALSRSVLDAGRPDEALPLLRRVLDLGAPAWALSAWSTAGGEPQPVRFEPLRAARWLPTLPRDVSVPLLDGSSLELDDARGRVLLLDFWASWCAPCRTEIPHLQSVYARYRDRGFLAVAVNVDEPDSVIAQVQKAWGLTMPIGRYGPSLHEVFKVETLPTVVLVDRKGRIRGRWDGYRTGLEREIAGRVQQLMDGSSLGGDQEVAQIQSGADAIELLWSRQLPSALEGLALSRTPAGDPKIAAAGRGSLMVLGPDGALAQQRRLPREVSALLPDGAGEGWIGFRAGARGWASIGADGVATRHETASEIYSAAAVPGGGVLLAGKDGLDLHGGDGARVRRLAEGTFVSATVAGSGDTVVFFGVDHAGTVHRFSEDGEASSPVGLAEGTQRVIAAGGDWGAAPPAVRAIEAGDGLAALVLGDDRLLVLSLEDGRTVLQAKWKGIRAVALSGSELAIASRNRVTVLRVDLEKVSKVQESEASEPVDPASIDPLTLD